jgi:cytosine/adenosine deaminase-related metal-dependent hydrolase
MTLQASRPSAPVAYRARWVLPIDRPPLDGGVVTVSGGRIAAVGENLSGEPPQDLGDVALLPALVNAHTHLEFSLLDTPLGQPGMPFPDWIKTLVEHRNQQNKALFVETDGFARHRRRAADKGLQELREAAVVGVGEVATPGWPHESLPASGLRVVLFLELLGLDRSKEPQLLALAQRFIDEVEDVGSSLRPGLSPHAPYTVSLELVEQVCQLAAQERVSVAMHLAESREELQLLAQHSGPLVEVLQGLDAWHPDAIRRGARPLDYLEQLAKAPRALVIHGNYLANDEIAFIASHRDRMSVVHCPRTHAYFGHSEYPLHQMTAAGVRVAVGTDSRASNPDLRVWEELRLLATQHPNLSHEQILRMGTLDGAEALGYGDRLGSITTGKLAKFATVSLPPGGGDPYELLFSHSDIRPLRG